MLTKKTQKIPKKYFSFSTIRTFAKLSSGCRAEESSSKKSFLVETESDVHKIRFGSQSNGKPWPGNVSAQNPVPHLPHSKVPHLPHSIQVTSWVCATIPMAGTVTYDCIPEVADLPLLVCGCLDPQPPLPLPPNHQSSTNPLNVFSLVVTLCVRVFPNLSVVKKCCQTLVAGKLDEAWSVTV